MIHTLESDPELAMTPAALAQVWERAPTFQAWLPMAVKNRELWAGLHARAILPEWAEEEALQIASPTRLLVLSADWCGDAVNSVPWVARLAEAAPALEMRILERDEHPGLMEAHLTGGHARSIPVVMAFDRGWEERGWWGPRPAELQRWVLGEDPGEGRTLPPDERYARVRRWYARDRGASILREILELVGDRPGSGSSSA